MPPHRRGPPHPVEPRAGPPAPTACRNTRWDNRREGRASSCFVLLASALWRCWFACCRMPAWRACDSCASCPREAARRPSHMTPACKVVGGRGGMDKGPEHGQVGPTGRVLETWAASRATCRCGAGPATPGGRGPKGTSPHTRHAQGCAWP